MESEKLNTLYHELRARRRVDDAELTMIERERYRRVWENPVYREESPAVRALDTVMQTVGRDATRRLIDLGCGTGRAARALHFRGYTVGMVDIADNAVELGTLAPPFICAALHEFDTAELWPREECAGYCIDVMEHIPEALVVPTFENIARNIAGPVYFRIALFGDEWGQQQGYGNLHPTVRPFVWWIQQAMGVFESGDAWLTQDAKHGGIMANIVVQDHHRAYMSANGWIVGATRSVSTQHGVQQWRRVVHVSGEAAHFAKDWADKR